MEAKGALKNKQVVLKQYVKEFPTEADFDVIYSTIIPSIPDGTKAVLLKNLYLGVDADLRRRLSNSEDYYSEEHQSPDNIQLHLHPIKCGSVISGYGVAKVVKSTNPNFREGDYVWGVTGWEEYTLIKDDPQFLRKINRFDDRVLKLSYYTGLLGIGGYAAYIGISYVAEPKQRAVVYVSAAAGGVGQLAGQFAKYLNGCYVVGSASTDEKVRLLKNEFGFDDAFNYKKETDISAALTRHCPNGIDLYFDNVGGPLLDEVLLHMNANSKIVVSGMISQYNLEKPDGIHNLFQLITKRITMEGFHIDKDHLNHYDGFVDRAATMLDRANIYYKEDQTNGLENAASALIGIFHGENVGKGVIVVTED